MHALPNYVRESKIKTMCFGTCLEGIYIYREREGNEISLAFVVRAAAWTPSCAWQHPVCVSIHAELEFDFSESSDVPECWTFKHTVHFVFLQQIFRSLKSPIHHPTRSSHTEKRSWCACSTVRAGRSPQKCSATQQTSVPDPLPPPDRGWACAHLRAHRHCPGANGVLDTQMQATKDQLQCHW